MDAPSTNTSAERAPAPTTWPIGVQFALCLIVTGALCFLLGRWSHSEPLRQLADAPAETAVASAIDLNRATKSELRLLPGIGDTLSQRIVDHRSRVGPFKSVDDLRRVSGIGPKTLERLQPHLFVGTGESYVSTDEEEPAPMESSKATPRPVPLSSKAASLTQPLNVNAADEAELRKLPGIGPKLSQRIVEERAKGAFRKVEDLRRVAGIGPKTLEKLKPLVTLE